MPRRQKVLPVGWSVSGFWFLVSGFELQAFVTFASFAAKNPTQSLTHSFRPVTDILRHPPMSKISISRIAFLETSQIIALPLPESNRKAKLLPTARLFQMRAFFDLTSLQIVFTSCPGCFQIIMQEKHSYAHGNPPRTSHIAICEQQAKANPPQPLNQSKGKAIPYTSP